MADKIIIALHTQQELRIYMSPARQRLLRVMALEGRPMTAKDIADRMGISASSVQHHLSLLLGLGLVKDDHTEKIHGITARYLRLVDATVRLGLETEDELTSEREALAQYLLNQVYGGFTRAAAAARARGEGLPARQGDFLSGIAYLRPEDGEQLLDLIRVYLDEHSVPAQGTAPWEYALVAYRADGQEGQP